MWLFSAQKSTVFSVLKIKAKLWLKRGGIWGYQNMEEFTVRSNEKNRC